MYYCQTKCLPSVMIKDTPPPPFRGRGQIREALFRKKKEQNYENVGLILGAGFQKIVGGGGREAWALLWSSCRSHKCWDFDLYLVGVQALISLDVERVPRQLHPHHVHGHIALLQRSSRWCSRGVDTVENCKRKNNILKSFAEIQQRTLNLGPYKELQ